MRAIIRAYLSLGVLAALCCVPALADGEGWTDDFEAAKAQAEKEGKDLLLDFTGSDWCGWCIKLRNEVFDQEAFKAEAPKHFVLVELDFPRSKPLTDKVKEQNQKLSQQFGIEGYPTIFLTDSKGRPYARTGYQAGGAEAYLKHMEELRARKAARDEEFAKADKAEGVEKARALDAALAALAQGQNGVTSGYDEVIQQIIELDGANEAGLKGKYEAKKRLAEASPPIEEALNNKEWDAALEKIDAFLKEVDPSGEAKQEMLWFRAIALYYKGDKEGAIKAFEGAHEAAPETEKGQQIPHIIEKIKSE
ncbi:MAG: thioredoxin family protein [Planctomycetes bacterium]|nr:thioredoxin family protein [Planctomycetota bacterium]